VTLDQTLNLHVATLHLAATGVWRLYPQRAGGGRQHLYSLAATARQWGETRRAGNNAGGQLSIVASLTNKTLRFF